MPNMGRLVQASVVMRGESPHGWQEFVSAMGEYAAAITADMVKCSPDMLPRAQGMAIQATEIAAIVRDAPQLYEKAQQAAAGKPRTGY
jgi:hypothetical protein